MAKDWSICIIYIKSAEGDRALAYPGFSFILYNITYYCVNSVIFCKYRVSVSQSRQLEKVDDRGIRTTNIFCYLFLFRSKVCLLSHDIYKNNKTDVLCQY